MVAKIKGKAHCKLCGEIFDYKRTEEVRICEKCRSETVLCKCGCGELTSKYTSHGEMKKGYCTYHHNRTEENKDKLRKRNALRKVHGPSPEIRDRMSFSRKGKGNPNWKGGLTQRAKGIRRSPDFFQWRKSVLEKDNRTCLDCGAKSNLDAHHIRPIIEYPEGIFEVSNGMTLCKDCHKIHTRWQYLRRKMHIKGERQLIKPKLSGVSTQTLHLVSQVIV